MASTSASRGESGRDGAGASSSRLGHSLKSGKMAKVGKPVGGRFRNVFTQGS